MDWIKIYGKLNGEINTLRKDIQEGTAGFPSGGKPGQVLVMGENGLEWQDADSLVNGGGNSGSDTPGVDVPENSEAAVDF